MARPPRIEVPDGVYHVVARGNERKAIYRDDSDRERFLELLQRIAERHTTPVLAYCLMSNHYHLLLKTPNANLARAMRDLNGSYAQAFNRRHGRDGHLFQGRYTAVLVQADSHLHAAIRYIVRNPLRAHMTNSVEEWRWTSHHATSGHVPPGLVSVDALLAYFHEARPAARRLYHALVNDERDPPGPAHPIVDGDDAFVTNHLTRIRPSPEHPRQYVVQPAPELDRLLPEPTGAAIAGAHRHGYSMRQIASHLGCSVTTIHRRIANQAGASETRKT